MKNYKLSLSSSDFATQKMPILLVGDIIENIKKASGLGYDGLEIHTRETADLDYPAIRDAMAAYGIGISAIATGKLCTLGKVDLIDARPYIRAAAIEGLRGYTAMASELGTDLVLGWVRGNIPPDGNDEYYLREFAGTLKTVCDFAAGFGVRIFLEVVNRYETNVFTTCKETIDFLERHQISNCFIHLDSYHMNIDEPDSVEAIRLAGQRLGYFHVAENTRRYPGSGAIDFKSQIDALVEIGFSGYVSVECFPDDDGYETAKKSIEYMKSLG